jgi:hypothetical protein
VYRMHMLLPEGFTVRGADGSSKENIWTGSTALSGARAVMVSSTQATQSVAIRCTCGSISQSMLHL